MFSLNSTFHGAIIRWPSEFRCLNWLTKCGNSFIPLVFLVLHGVIWAMHSTLLLAIIELSTGVDFLQSWRWIFNIVGNFYFQTKMRRAGSTLHYHFIPSAIKSNTTASDLSCSRNTSTFRGIISMFRTTQAKYPSDSGISYSCPYLVLNQLFCSWQSW